MNEALGELKNYFISIAGSDVLIAHSEQEHVNHAHQVVSKLLENLPILLEKCELHQILGYILHVQGVESNQTKELAENLTHPNTQLHYNLHRLFCSGPLFITRPSMKTFVPEGMWEQSVQWLHTSNQKSG